MKKSVNELKFEAAFFDKNDFEFYVNSIEKPNETLEKISFQNCRINDSMIYALYDIFDPKLFPRLKEIDLSDNFITDQGFSELLNLEASRRQDFIKEFNDLPINKTIILKGNQVKNHEEIIRIFEETIKNNDGKVLPVWNFIDDFNLLQSDENSDTWKDVDLENEQEDFPNKTPEVRENTPKSFNSQNNNLNSK